VDLNEREALSEIVMGFGQVVEDWYIQVFVEIFVGYIPRGRGY